MCKPHDRAHGKHELRRCDLSNNYSSMAKEENRAKKGNLHIFSIDRRSGLEQTFIGADKDDDINRASDALDNTGKIEYCAPSTSCRSVPEETASTSEASAISNNEPGIQDTNEAIENSENLASDELFALEHVDVNMIQDDITKIKADVIIVPGNEMFLPLGGVAKAVFDAAGQELVATIREKTKGKARKVGDVLFTPSGALKGNISQIVHIVISSWISSDYRTGKMTCLYSLISALSDSFKECTDKSLTKIALPAIGTGFCGIPRKLCSLVYLFALNKLDEYCKSKYRTKLEIAFVDKDKDILDYISKEFKDTAKKGLDYLEDYIDEEVDKMLEIITHHIGPTIGMKVFQGNITLFLGSSILCAVSKDLKPCGKEAASIFKHAGKEFQKELVSHKKKRKIKTGEVIVTGPCSLCCSHIFSCVMPKQRILFKGRANYKEKLIKCYANVFLQASEKNIPRVTLYVLGGDTDYLGMDMCCSALEDSLEFLSKSWVEQLYPPKLHITCSDKTLLDRLLNQLERLFRNG